MMTLVAALLATLAAAGLTQGEPPPAAACAAPPYTSARLTTERMAELVSGPLELIERGDVAGAERAFAEQLARSRRSSAETGDMLVSFGMTLFHETEARQDRVLGIAYMRRALGAYTEAFGRIHPEVGLILSDIANAWLVIEPDDLPQEAEQALAEAWRIRSATLGPGNVEAVSTLLTLARLRGHPSRTGGDPARIAASAELFERAIRDFGTCRVVPGDFGSITARFDLARMYLRNGLPREAFAAALGAQADYRAHFARERDMCYTLIGRSRTFAAELADAGHKSEADALRAGLRQGLSCYVDDSLGDIYLRAPDDKRP